MATTAPLDLAYYHDVPRVGKGISSKRLALVLVGVLLLGGFARFAIMHFGQQDLRAPLQSIRIPLSDAQRVAAISVDDRSQLIAEGNDAVERNAAIPMTHHLRDEMRSFTVPLSSTAGATALKCLTQAVYYEAATEPLQGRRAVAQVVLNRVRHPLYPNSVCGVVYQGSERQTGCQFSFTCDGSLLRSPAARPWHEAEEIARQALNGYVEPTVGTATFYHADYVLPNWAFRFDKVAKEGRHIFYSFPGTWGRAATFSDGYGGNEHIPALNFASLRDRLAQREAEDPASQFVPGLTVAPLISDRHAEADVGGRIDTTKPWRLSDPADGDKASRLLSLVNQQASSTPKQANSSQ